MATDNIHTVLVEGAIQRVDALDATVKRADSVDAEAMVIAAIDDEDADTLVDDVKRAAVMSSMQGLAQQRRLVQEQVRAESAVLVKADPATVPQVTHVDIAQKRAEQLGADKESD